MAKNLLLSTVFFVACSLTGLAQTKDIVINENTYKKLTATGVNHVRMAKKADKRKGIIRVKDAPHERILFEKLISQNPTTGELPNNFRQRELKFLSNNKNQFISRTKSQNINWKQTGPYNVGGRTRALAIDVTDDNIILAGGATGGMWRSENGGEFWTKTTVTTEHQSVTAVAQDPREGHTNIWYYATGEYSGSAGASGAFYSGTGIFKSEDGGKNWAKIEDSDKSETPMFTELFDICWNITVDPTNGDLYVATYGGIYKYNFGEVTRNLVLNSKPTSGDDTKKYSVTTDIVCTPSGIKYATLSGEGEINGFYKSTTGNTKDWKKITPNGLPTNFNRTVLAYAPNNENILYFLSETPGKGLNGHSLWKLTVNGEKLTWVDRSQNLPSKGTSDNDVSGYSSQGSYDMVIKVAPNDENMVFIGGTNLHRSDDGFETKTKTFWIGGYATENNVSQYDNHHPDQHSLAFYSDGKTLLSGHDGGISKTSNYKQTKDSGTEDDIDHPSVKPVDWISLNNGYLTTQAYTVGIDAKDETSFEILTGFQDNGTWYTSKDNDGVHKKDWIQLGSGDGSYCSMHNSLNGYITSSQKGRIYLNAYNTVDKEWEWSRVDPEGVDSDDVLFINPYEIDGNNEAIMYYAGGTDIWRNTDTYKIPRFSNSAASKGWEKIENTSITGKISAIESSINPANILYYGTSSGKIYRINHANNDQASKTDITGVNMPSNAYVSCIETNPLDANQIFVSFSNYEVQSIFYSEDGGNSWTNASGNLEITKGSKNIGPSIRYVNIVNTIDGPIYFACTSIGLYKTTDLNANTQWTQVSTDLIGNTVTDMIKTRQDGFVAVGTHGNGIFSTQYKVSNDYDGDGISNDDEIANNTDPLDACDPNNETDECDFDNDYISNLIDTDDDGDGIEDDKDTDPFDPQSDTDEDGISDIDETTNSTDPLDRCDPRSDQPTCDFDNDGTPNLDDEDDDNDGVLDQNDPDPLDECNPYNLTDNCDFDGDNISNGEDTDDDNDGVVDDKDIDPFDPQSDSDSDDISDIDETTNLTNPLDECDPDNTRSSCDFDNDGTPNSEDEDDDNDGILDNADDEPFIAFVLGIEDIDEVNTKLSIYPNPMVNTSRIAFPNKENESYRLIVIDASGRVVRIIENITNNNITINREQLKPGIHIINLEGEKIYKGKLLVK